VDITWRCFVHLRIIPASTHRAILTDKKRCSKNFVRFNFPVNLITAPLIADLFLLAISAIGRKEVHDGTVGANHIHPLDIMAFFITLAYIAISIDASGIIRWLAFKVLSWGGKVGHRLFFYLYAFFFLLGSFIGNDPIILSGTAFLAYMTRVSKNITSPRAWIFTQFAIANIASAILVSSNPTNLVLAGAFDIKFIVYTANMIVPVVVTAVVLFPFLLYVVFADEKLIPSEIEMHTLPAAAREKEPVNPNIPYVQHQAEEAAEGRQGQEMTLSLEYIMNPFLDRKGAAFGALIMSATLITVLAINAASTSKTGETPVFWVMFCWDLGSGWIHRHETRQTAKIYREEMENARAERTLVSRDESEPKLDTTSGASENHSPMVAGQEGQTQNIPLGRLSETNDQSNSQSSNPKIVVSNTARNSPVLISGSSPQSPLQTATPDTLHAETMPTLPSAQMEPEKLEAGPATRVPADKPNLVSKSREAYEWLQETFPTVMAVAAHLPFALVPFAFAMFVLVQGLVSTGWVNVFAWGWYHWSKRTGTIGSIGGMGFLSVVLSNVSLPSIQTQIASF
jgi:Na+/H+ antiporter NhaD/arsenite permease-like protein